MHTLLYFPTYDLALAINDESDQDLIIIIIIIIISLLNPLVVYNTKLQGRSRIRRTHNYTWHRRQKQLNPIVTVGNKITKAVRSDKAEFRTRKTRPQPVPMSDIRGLRQQV